MSADRINRQSAYDDYGISRIDDEKNRTFAWRVKLMRHGRQHVKNFPDLKFGGGEQALHRARQYRDELVRTHPPITRKEMCLIKRSNNKSGITGVCTYAKRYVRRDGSVKENWYWEGSWPNDKGESIKAVFPVNKYGSELARQMAINARQRGVDCIEGVFWRSEPGALSADELVHANGSAQQDVAHLAPAFLKHAG